jgi:hypothetical protein
MGLAANLFHWSPQTFWRATPHEFFAAYEMWQRMNPPPSDF